MEFKVVNTRTKNEIAHNLTEEQAEKMVMVLNRDGVLWRGKYQVRK